MPAVKEYVVTVEREVKVTAEDPGHAAQLAQNAVENPQNDMKEDGVRTVRTTGLIAREEY